MRKTLILVTGILLCLVLSGCSGQDNLTVGDKALSLQNMTVDIPEQETEQDESAGGAGEYGAAMVDADTVGAGEHRTISADESAVGAVEGAAGTDTPNRDFEEIKEYLAQFPNTLQELSETECYVIRHGIEHSGREYLNVFIENVKAENSGELVFVQFTTEGAPILTYLNYDGENVYCVEDISRDGFAGGNGEKYFEKYYDSIWLTSNTDAEGNTSLSLCALWEEDMVLELFTALTEEALWYGLPPWAKPPAP